MFEQSILPDSSAAQNKGALAASFSAQMLAAGVCIVVPLLSHEVLPAFRLSTIPLHFRPYNAAPVESAPKAQPNTSSESPLLLPPRRVWNPTPRASSNPPVGTTIITDLPFDLGDVPVAGLPAAAAQPRESVVIPAERIKPPEPVAKPVEKQPQAPVMVTSEIQAAKILRKVVPAYPPLAKMARVQGTVKLVGTIAKDGTIQQLRLLSGHPLLAPAALEAVRQWLYRPTILNGEPVEVIAPIDVNFTLQ